MESEDGLQGTLEQVRTSLVDFTRTANEISAKDLGFIRTLNPKAGKQLDKSNARLLRLSKKLLQSAVTGTALQAPDLSNADDVEDNWRGIVDVIDNLLEKTDLALDECTGAIKRHVSEPEHEPDAQRTMKMGFKSNWSRKSAIPKPQVQFQKPPNNASGIVFKPLLQEKPHAVVLLDETLKSGGEDGGYQHPYRAEIESYKYPSLVYEKREPVPFAPLDASEAVFVDTPDGVNVMLAELKQAKEIAIDLEHHDRHSYIGIVSLMQISTRDKDWIVDTLKPWREDLQVLNEVFADPSILKVFHGAAMDIIWLQRDLGLYVVGLFDTYHASTELHYERHSLAFLLKKFVGFEAQKQYQLADWRIRPLPKELHDYARSDTHFLLNIYDHMRNELIDQSARTPKDKNLVDQVMDKSKEVSLKKYEHYSYDAIRGTGSTGWYNMLIRTPALFNQSQFAVFKAVHQWRDSLAREEDENLQGTMSNQAIFNIARMLPDELPKLYTCIQPLSDFVKDRIEELLQLVIKAKIEGERGPDMKAVLAEHPLTLEYEQRKAERKQAYSEPHPQQAAQAGDDPVSGEVHRQMIIDADANMDNIIKKDSDFWGGAWDAGSALDDANGPDLRFTVPMPPVIQAETAAAPDESFQDLEMNNELAVADATAQQTGMAPLQGYPTEPEQESSTFILREGTRNRKRKAANARNGNDNGNDKDDDDDPTGRDLADALQEVHDEEQGGGDEAHDAKRARKAAKNAEKAAKRAEKARAKQALQEEAPFDYAAAPSVLDAARNGGPATGRGGGARPYDKAMDAPKGLPRVKREFQGKSMTFRD